MRRMLATIRSLAAVTVLAIVFGAVIAMIPFAARVEAAPSTATSTARPGAAPSARGKTANATAKPNFTGTWSLDTLHSEFGKLPGGRPLSRTDLIEHRGSSVRQTLLMVNAGSKDTAKYLYVIGGQATANLVDGRTVTSTVSWEKNVLRLVSKVKMLVFEWTLDERWSLSPDGTTLTMSRHIHSPPIGEGEQKLVFRKK